MEKRLNINEVIVSHEKLKELHFLSEKFYKIMKDSIDNKEDLLNRQYNDLQYLFIMFEDFKDKIEYTINNFAIKFTNFDESDED